MVLTKEANRVCLHLFAMLVLPSVRGGAGGGGGLWVCFSCTLLSLEVGMGPKQNDSEKSASTLKICIKISGKPKRPGSL